MPQVFDNISESLLPALRNTLQVAHRADFCIGYFNLRGWRSIDDLIDRWPGGDDACCRLLVGMQPQPHEELRRAMRLAGGDAGIDNQRALRLRRQLADRFREQLTLGAPTAADEAGLRRLARQLRGGKVVVKLFCRHPLHAKLYLLFRRDPVTPVVGYVGSSNLTLPAQPGGQALSRHSRVHRQERQQVHPAFRHALQQDLQGSLQPAAPVRRARTKTSAFARND